MKAHNHAWWVFAGFIFIGAAIGCVWYARTRVDFNNLPQFIQADFIDLDHIYSISKFRSGSGHDFSSNGETCRSMKHYFNVQNTSEKFVAWENNNNLPPAPIPGKSIDIFSPVDGEIVQVQADQMPIGTQVHIVPDTAPQFTVRLFHVYLLPGITKGSRVTAGQKIGEISIYQDTDIAIVAGGFPGQLISYFQVMPDSMFARYQARGVPTRDELTISREYRDANPLQCNGEQFVHNRDNPSDTENFVQLSGWQDASHIDTGRE